MVQIQVMTRKWGNSLGIALPKKLVDAKHLRENQQLIIQLKLVSDIKQLKGLVKFKKSAQQLKDEMRKGW